MQRSLRPVFAAAVLFSIFVISSLSPLLVETSYLSDLAKNNETAMNVPTTISIASHPDGTSNVMQLEVPVDHAVTDLGISLEPHILPRTESISWNSISDWNMSGVVNDGVDFNSSSGLTVLPTGYSWDFESGAFGNAWSHSGNSHWTVQSSTRLSGTYTPQSGYISHNQWTAMSVTISNMVGTGSFKYRTSTESNYDYLLFCIDNTGCYRYGGYTYRWSGYNSGTQTFNIAAGTHTYTWKYYKDGSVNSGSDRVWVDDIEFNPSSGGTGSGNWTSSPFGPSATGTQKSLEGQYGLVSVDATVPSNSALTWSVLDGISKQPIPGYENINKYVYDIGGIDSEKHQTLRIKLHLDQPSGSPPVVHGVYVQGRYVSSFNADPGWTGNLNWDGNSFPGSGTIDSPVFELRRPISRIKTDITSSGGGTWQMKINDDVWANAPQASWQTLSTYAHKVQFRWIGSSSSSDLRSVDIQIDSGGMPEFARMDVGEDGIIEWGIDSASIGKWGWQDRLSDGTYSKDFTWTTSGTKQIGLWLPKDGLEAMSYTLTPSSSGVQNLSTSLSISGTEVMSRQIGTVGDVSLVILTPAEIMDSNSLLLNATSIWPNPGVQTGIEYVQAVFSVTSDYGGVQLGGVAAVHHPTANLLYDSQDEMVWAVNDLIPYSTILSGSKYVPLTVQMNNPGSLIGTITSLNYSNEMTTDSLTILNGTTTLTPSRQWLEVNTTHSAPAGTVAAVQMDLIGTNHQVRMLCQNDGSLAVVPGSSDAEMVHWKQGDGCELDVNGSDVNSVMRFRLNASWDDDPSMTMKVRLVLIDGRRSVPKLQEFGAGENLAIENDVEIVSWEMYNQHGVPIPTNRQYLQSNSPITISVDLGFPGIDRWLAPRSGDVAVRVFENGIVIANSTSLTNGSIDFNLNTPLSSQPVEYRLDILPLHQQENASSITVNRTYEIDSLAPMVIEQNIRKYDHLEQSLNQLIKIEIYDRPILPDDLSLMLWRDWADDFNADGKPNATEFIEYSMQAPSNTSQAQGNYTFSFDDTDGPNGGIVAGYISGSDAAGNEVTRAGGPAIGEQLFTYQLAQDGDPLIVGQGGFVDGDHSWLHPATLYEIVIPFNEPNGLSDLDYVQFQLASNSIVDSLEVIWNATTNRCNSTGQYLIVNSCHIHARTGEITPFSGELELRLEFTLDWGIPLENDLRRAPAITVKDRAGAESWLELPQLRWRYSPNLAISSDSILLESEGGAIIDQSVWVQPNTGLNISGQVTFVETGLAPTLPFDVSILLDGQRLVTSTVNGYFLAQLSAPSESKSHALSFELTGLPPEAVDATDPAETLFWVEVDSNAPLPVSIDAPREGTNIPLADLSDIRIELRLSEQEKLNVNSLKLFFKVSYASQVNGAALIEGSSPLNISGSPVGQSISAYSIIDVESRLPEDSFSDQLVLSIWVKGSDLAGNGMQSSSLFNSGSTPFASWNIEHLAADIQLTQVTYSRSGELEVDQTTMVTIEFRNTGFTAGSMKFFAYEVGRDGENRSLTPVPISVVVPVDERLTYDIDWIPEDKGERWVVIVLEDGTSLEGKHINVRTTGDDQALSGVLEGVPMSWLVIIAVLLLILTLTVSLALRSGGSSESSLDGTDDWEDDWEDEEEDETESTYASPSKAMAEIQSPESGYENQQTWGQEQVGYHQQQVPQVNNQQYTPPQQVPQQPVPQPTEQQSQQWTEAQWQAYQQQYAEYYQSGGQPPPSN